MHLSQKLFILKYFNDPVLKKTENENLGTCEIPATPP